MGTYTDLVKMQSPAQNEQKSRQSTQEPRKLANQEAGKPATQLPRKSAPGTKNVIPDPRSPSSEFRVKVTFDLLKKDNDFLEELKYKFRDQKVKKYEVVSAALELLEKDYIKNQETSFLARKFSGHPGTQEAGQEND